MTPGVAALPSCSSGLPGADSGIPGIQRFLFLLGRFWECQDGLQAEATAILGVPAPPQAPSSPRGDPARGHMAAVTALSRGTRPSHGCVTSGCSSLWGSRVGVSPKAAPAPQPSLPPSLPPGRGKKPHSVHFQRSFGCKSVYTWRGKIFLSCRVGIFIE